MPYSSTSFSSSLCPSSPFVFQVSLWTLSNSGLCEPSPMHHLPVGIPRHRLFYTSQGGDHLQHQQSKNVTTTNCLKSVRLQELTPDKLCLSMSGVAWLQQFAGYNRSRSGLWELYEWREQDERAGWWLWAGDPPQAKGRQEPGKTVKGSKVL